MLLTILEGELPQIHPTDQEEQLVEGDGAEHIIGGRWRGVREESNTLFVFNQKRLRLVLGDAGAKGETI